ncbi:MAG: RdgB/HAM1 family non-canonical purine NTP pyrophosphatase [Hyphomicrobiaceae bacterium]
MTKPLQPGDQLVVATHNPGKLDEIRALMAPFGIKTNSAGELGLPEPEETGTTFAANAALKARAAAVAAKLPALADDSGIEIAALDGAPGVYSADWGGPNKDFTGAMQRVRDEILAKDLWTDDGPAANFNATLAFAWPDGEVRYFEGKVFGRLVWPPRGTNGFGYDPMFLADGESKTFGEMTRVEKQGRTESSEGGLSHRARALRQFVAACVVGDR